MNEDKVKPLETLQSWRDIAENERLFVDGELALRDERGQEFYGKIQDIKIIGTGWDRKVMVVLHTPSHSKMFCDTEWGISFSNYFATSQTDKVFVRTSATNGGCYHLSKTSDHEIVTIVTKDEVLRLEKQMPQTKGGSRRFEPLFLKEIPFKSVDITGTSFVEGDIVEPVIVPVESIKDRGATHRIDVRRMFVVKKSWMDGGNRKRLLSFDGCIGHFEASFFKLKVSMPGGKADGKS